jgi:hypothetical protein
MIGLKGLNIQTARPTSFQFDIGLDEAGALNILWRSGDFPLAVDVGAAPTRSVPKTDGLLLSQSTMFRL